MSEPDIALEEGEKKLAAVSGVEVLLCRSGGKTYAIGTHCPHQGASLADGKLRGRTISCPLHGARFHMSTGRALGSPYPPIEVYDLDRLQEGVAAPMEMKG